MTQSQAKHSRNDGARLQIVAAVETISTVARGSAILHTMTTDVPERLSFPCDYPIKVMVRVEDGVRSQVDAIVERHAGPLDLGSVTERPSTQGNFLGITYLIRAESPDQIAQLFAALKQCPQVMLVL
jgi:uncharacterized protein